ncbi:uncharacterized protein A4U43_UnF3920 [Asparagus officinalis]|uniref:Cystathionine gamma-synthase n=1 Tax=Asparagus officinalis TaxID=4686 RepID=A0A1R3L714_ASPOF|nr:uncharacterized protein A4U43_UnF3920 [Asparagus officinalis]
MKSLAFVDPTREQGRNGETWRYYSGNQYEDVNYEGDYTYSLFVFFFKAKGAGSVLSFLTGSLALSKHIVDTVKYFSTTVSFGSVKSLISLPCFMSHASIPASVRESRGLTEDLVRISVGIEDAEDLIADLDYAIRSGPI